MVSTLTLSWTENTMSTNLGVVGRARLEEVGAGDIVMTRPGVFWSVVAIWSENIGGEMTSAGRAYRMRLAPIDFHDVSQRTPVFELPRPDHERRS